MMSRAKVLIILVVCLILKQTFSTEIEDPQPKKIGRKWVTKILSEHIWDFKITSSTNPVCTRHFEIYQQHQENFTTWALQMLDSSALAPSGFLVGDSYNLGNYEECVDTQVPEEFGFSAQYCLSTFHLSSEDITLKSSEISDEWKNPIWKRIQDSKNSRIRAPKDRFRLAFCVPSTCSPEDLQTSLQNLLEGPMKRQAYDLNVTTNHLDCSTKDELSELAQNPSFGHLAMRYFLIIMTAILLFSSTVDILLAAVLGEKYDIMNCSLSKAKGVEKWVLPFSIFRNVRKLWAPPISSEDYKILHGIKGFLQIMTILGHHGGALFKPVAIMNWPYYENRYLSFGLVEGMLLIPDAFLCISGFIVTLAILKQLERSKFNAWAIVAMKIVRALPSYIFVVTSVIFIIPHLGSGPRWKAVIEPEVDYCRRGWWTNFLFVTNFLRPHDWCLPHGWYADVDMQCFLMGILIVYCCTRWESHKIPILSVALLLSCLVPFTVVYRNRNEGLWIASYDIYEKHRGHQLFEFYTKSYNRFGCYMVGICSAYLAHYLLKKGYKLSKISSWVSVLVGLLMVAAVVIFRQTLDSPIIPYNVFKHALYAGFYAQIFGAGLMIIVIVQITTGFGALNALFLTQNMFLPISRLSYWLFHINFPLVFYQVALKKTQIYLTYENMMIDSWGGVFLTFSIALYGYLIIEAPINHIITSLSFKRVPHIQSTSGKKVK